MNNEKLEIGGWRLTFPLSHILTFPAMVQDICFHNVANFIGIQG